jgi:hypothetical protein
MSLLFQDIQNDIRQGSDGFGKFMMGKTFLWRSAVSFLALTASATTTWAAEADQATPPASNGSGFGDIVVTANKRSENVQKVPIAVTAFSGDQLKALGVTDTTQITQHVPGCNSTPGRPTSRSSTCAACPRTISPIIWKARWPSMSTTPISGR